MSDHSKRPSSSPPHHEAAVGEGECVGGGSGRPPGRLRKWGFRVAAAALAPLLFVLLLEAALALCGYGEPTRFFDRIDGRQACTSNQRFGWQFFPRAIARAPEPFYLAAGKPAGTYRIFVLGGSAAFGTPDNAFSFGRVLGVMLRERYPNGRFEVVNAAMTAVNSHVVRQIARQCAEMQPDLFLVYMGHNEVAGPYGPGTVFARFSPSLSSIRLAMWLKTTHTGQLLSDLTGWAAPGEDRATWAGMEMFLPNRLRADDSRLTTAYGHLRENLEDIISAGVGVGAKAIVCTVATNLKDCPPFASMHRAGMPAEDRATFDALYQAGRKKEKAGRHAEAMDRYLLAEAMRADYAELHFALGRLYLAARHREDARAQFVLARDLDVLRFRADSRINEVIRQVATGRADEGVYLVDVGRVLEADPQVTDGILGNELLYEHVHPNFEGNFRIAAALLAKLATVLPAGTRAGEAQTPSMERCAELLALTAWDRHRMLAGMARLMSRPPFSNQLDHEAARQRLQKALAESQKALTPEAIDAAVQVYKAAIQQAPEDLLLRNNFASLLVRAGRPAETKEHVRFVLDRLPNNADALNAVGALLGRQGKIDEAIAHFRRGLVALPDHPHLHANLGAALARQGKLDGAAAHMERARRARPDDVEILLAIAELALVRGKGEEAIKLLDQVSGLDGDDVRALVRSAEVCLRLGRGDEAIGRYRQGLALRPDDPDLHNELGAALVQKGQFAEAAERFRSALRDGPDRPKVLMNLAGAMVLLRRFDDAITHLNEALQLDPKLARAHGMLGWAWQTKGNAALAMDCYSKAVQIDPNDADSRLRLAEMLATRKCYAEAAAHYQAALARRPKDAAARHRYGAVLHELGREAEALEQLAASVELQPALPALARLAWLLSKRGQDAQAIRHYRKVLGLRADWAPALEGLAWVLATSPSQELRNGDEAIDLAMKACEVTGFKAPRPLVALAAAFAEKAQFDRAVRTAQRALALAPAERDEELTRRVEQCLVCFQAGKPFRRTVAAGKQPATDRSGGPS